jgi:cellulose biosynthesis protein BcsQ
MNNMIKRLILILNGKGGVGKSFFAVNLVQYLKDKNIGHAACDCDNENSTLKRFHGDAVEFLDLSQPRGLDAMFRALEKTDLAVVDCRAASTEVFFDYFDEIDLRATLQTLSVALTLVIPVNHEADSVDQLQRIVTKLENTCAYVVLRNQVHDDTFTVYDQSVVRRRLRKELGAKEITMTKLQPWLVEELSLKNLPVSSAIQDGQLYLLDRQRLQTWQRKLYTEIESAAELLLPAKA